MTPKSIQRLSLYFLIACAISPQGVCVQGKEQTANSNVASQPTESSADKDLVALAITVIDQKKHLVADLQGRDFAIYEDGEQQKIVSFSCEDAPASIGILIDDSGSMRPKVTAVNTAVNNLYHASNHQDEFFIVNFNDSAFLDQDFTSNPALLQQALDRRQPRGGTAFYDAIIASSDHVIQAAKYKRKALIIISDGDDNSSRYSLAQAIHSIQRANGPVIYAVALLKDDPTAKARHALETVTRETGGAVFFPRNLKDVSDAAQKIGEEIRNQYTISYASGNSPDAAKYRKLKIVAQAPAYKNLTVQARAGFYSEMPGVRKTSSK